MSANLFKLTALGLLALMSCEEKPKQVEQGWVPNPENVMELSVKDHGLVITRNGHPKVWFTLLEGADVQIEKSQTGYDVLFDDAYGNSAKAIFELGNPQIVWSVQRAFRNIPTNGGSGSVKLLVDDSSFWAFEESENEHQFRQFPKTTTLKKWSLDPTVFVQSSTLPIRVDLRGVDGTEIIPESKQINWAYPTISPECGPHDPQLLHGAFSLGNLKLIDISPSSLPALRTVGVSIGWPDSGPLAPLSDDDAFKRWSVVAFGHSDTNDPRYGNGGLGSLEMVATPIANRHTTKIPSAEKYDEDACGKPMSTVFRDEESTVKVLSNGSTIYGPPKARPLSGLVSTAFGKPNKLGFYHAELLATRDVSTPQPRGSWIKPDRDGTWTLSQFAAKRLADLEILNESGVVEFAGVRDIADRLARASSNKPISWSPQGQVSIDAQSMMRGIRVFGDVVPKSDVTLKRVFENGVTLIWTQSESEGPVRLSFENGGAVGKFGPNWTTPPTP